MESTGVGVGEGTGVGVGVGTGVSVGVDTGVGVGVDEAMKVGEGADVAIKLELEVGVSCIGEGVVAVHSHKQRHKSIAFFAFLNQIRESRKKR